MVVRLRDIRSGKKEEENKSGVVRLSDLRSKESISENPASRSGTVRSVPGELIGGNPSTIIDGSTHSLANGLNFDEGVRYGTDFAYSYGPNSPTAKKVADVSKKAAESEALYEQQYNALPSWRKRIVDFQKTPVGRFILGAHEASSEALSGALDTATFGATRAVDRRLANSGLMDAASRKQFTERVESAENPSTARTIGEFAGYILPGTAAERVVAAAAKPIVRSLPKLARNVLTYGTSGALDAAAQEAGDVAFRKGEFDPLNVAIGAGIGGAIPALGQGISSSVRKLRGFADNAASDAVQGNLRVVSDAVIDNAPHIPQSVRRVVSPSRVPEVFPERARRDFSTPQTSAVSNNTPSQPVRLSDIRQQAAEVSDRNVPKGVRANFSNQLDNGDFSEELQQQIRNTDQTYEIKTNQSSLNAANEAVKDMSSAQGKFLNSEASGPEHIAIGYRLMQELDALGDHAGALAVSRKLAEDLTKSGQTSQAASIISRLSPEGQLLNLVRTAERNGKEVSVADRAKFKQLASEVQEASGAGIRANQFNDVINKIENGGTATPEEMKILSDYIERAEKVLPQRNAPEVENVTVREELPVEFKTPRKREKIVSFLDNAEQAALARISARKNRLNALPLDEWADHAIVVASQIAKGTIKAATHVEDLVRMFGEEIRPVASQVFQKAQGMIRGVSRSAGSDDIERATDALNRLSGQQSAEKAIVQETANHVRKLIADAKAGNLNPEDVQKLRDYSAEIAEMLEGSKKPRRVPTQEERFLQSVKSLAKKIAQVDSGSIPKDQANREVSSLIRQVTNIADEGKPKAQKTPIDNEALSNIAHDVMEKTRPTPKPTTPQEKLIEKFIREQGKKGGTVSQKDIDTLRNLAKDVTRLSGDSKTDADIAMQKILNSYEKSSAWDKLLAIRYMSMLLNTGTQAVNAISGPIMATTGAVADVLPAMMDSIMSKVLNKPRTITTYGTNPLRFMARYLKNLKTGARAGWQGVNPAGIQSTNEIRGLAFKNLYNPLGIAERTLGAVSKGADYATYQSVFQSEMAKQAYLDAVNSGVKGRNNIKNHIINYVNNPPPAAVEQADRIGKNTTFQRSDSLGGKAANWLNSAPPYVKPIVNSIFPFVRTPINIASAAVGMTPAGIIKGLYQLTGRSTATRREALRTLGMGLTGTAGIGALGYYLEQIGIITGANDSGDKDVDSIREQAGMGKYRFNTSALQRYLGAMFNGEGFEAAEKAAKYQEGDKQFDYNKLQPLAFPAAIGASLSENRDKSGLQRIAKAGEDAFGSLFGMSTLKGAQSVFQPSYGGTTGEKALGVPERIAESFFKSFSPSGLAQEARRQDPYQRQTSFNNGLVENVTDYFKSRTPGLSKSLPERKTTLGQSYTNPPGISGAYANPFRSEVAPYNEAAVIISGLIDRTGNKGLAPSAPEKTVKGKKRGGGSESVTITIPTDRYAKLQEDIGSEIVRRIVALPKSSDERMSEAIEKIYSSVKEKEMNKVKKELGIRVGG